MKRVSSLLPILVPVLALSGCGALPPSPPATPTNVLEVSVQGLQFEAPDEIPSGWVTVRLKNESAMTHFAVVERLPEGYGIAEQQEQVAPIFQEGMDLLNEGKTEEAMARFAELPEWFGQIVFLGGPGLIAPGRTAETTVHLEPGSYLLECYVKTDGIFHSYNPSPDLYGMVHAFTVTDEASEATEPEPSLEITLSSQRGLEVSGSPAAGEHTVAVRFEDQVTHENFLGHDVHLARLDDGTDLEALAAWMDWRGPTGLETPAPAEFLGGTHEMPAGGTAYITVTLEPGTYAWIAEVSDPARKGMLRTFTVE